MTQDSEEWGPWIEHDGKGCPCEGLFVEVKLRCGYFYIVEAANKSAVNKFHVKCPLQPNNPKNRWVWGTVDPSNEIIRYRIRKPRAMKQINALLQDLPQDVKEEETL